MTPCGRVLPLCCVCTIHWATACSIATLPTAPIHTSWPPTCDGARKDEVCQAQCDPGYVFKAEALSAECDGKEFKYSRGAGCTGKPHVPGIHDSSAW